jgi:hypothetical protein
MTLQEHTPLKAHFRDLAHARFTGDERPKIHKLCDTDNSALAEQGVDLTRPELRARTL